MLINVCPQKAAFITASTAEVKEVYAFTQLFMEHLGDVKPLSRRILIFEDRAGTPKPIPMYT